MSPEEKQKLLEEFLERWPESAVKAMQLNDYVGIDDKDTFTYWVETRMRPLGSIKGAYSTKFGIYRRKNSDKLSGNYYNDDHYTWMKRFGDNREAAFNSVKDNLLEIIKFAKTGDFAKIDDIGIPKLFKWKVASLYSNERLVPIFKQEVLLRIAAAFGLRATSHTKYSQIHELLISNKPADQDIYSYMELLYEIYGLEQNESTDNPPLVRPKDLASILASKRSNLMVAKSTSPQIRSGAKSYIAKQNHNKIQESLIRRLIKEHGEAAVRREENRVDVKLVLPDQIVFYEVKSASYPYFCIREALGQVIEYVFRDQDTRKKRIVVVGQYPPNPSDQNFIEFVRSLLNIEFSYEYESIKDTN